MEFRVHLGKQGRASQVGFIYRKRRIRGACLMCAELRWFSPFLILTVLPFAVSPDFAFGLPGQSIPIGIAFVCCAGRTVDCPHL